MCILHIYPFIISHESVCTHARTCNLCVSLSPSLSLTEYQYHISRVLNWVHTLQHTLQNTLQRTATHSSIHYNTLQHTLAISAGLGGVVSSRHNTKRLVSIILRCAHTISKLSTINKLTYTNESCHIDDSEMCIQNQDHINNSDAHMSNICHLFHK